MPLRCCCLLILMIIAAGCGGTRVAEPPSGPPDAAAIEPVASVADLSERMTWFYLHPDPGAVPPVIDYAIAHGDDDDMRSCAGITTTFVMQVMGRFPDHAVAWCAAQHDRPLPRRAWLLYALWWSGHPEADRILGDVTGAAEDAALVGKLQALIGHRPVAIDDAPSIDPAVLDQWWVSFMATGEARYVDLIAEVALTAKQPDVINMARETARWSLAANARQHERVHEIIRARLDRERDGARRLEISGWIAPSATETAPEAMGPKPADEDPAAATAIP